MGERRVTLPPMRFLAILIFPVLLTAADVPANRCATVKPFSPGPGDWNGWGVDAINSRFQPQPGLAAADVPRLKLKWAFGFPGETRTQSQPVIVGGRVFVGSTGGTVYSLDAATGCLYWTYDTGAFVKRRRRSFAWEATGLRFSAMAAATRTR